MLGEKPYSLALIQPLFIKFPLFSSYSPPFTPPLYIGVSLLVETIESFLSKLSTY